MIATASQICDNGHMADQGLSGDLLGAVRNAATETVALHNLTTRLGLAYLDAGGTLPDLCETLGGIHRATWYRRVQDYRQWSAGRE